MDSVREGEGGKIWENGIETCKISCMKRIILHLKIHLQEESRVEFETLNYKTLK